VERGEKDDLAFLDQWLLHWQRCYILVNLVTIYRSWLYSLILRNLLYVEILFRLLLREYR
jgi:hypothetical protein